MRATSLYFELEGEAADMVIKCIKEKLKNYLKNSDAVELITLETGFSNEYNERKICN